MLAEKTLHHASISKTPSWIAKLIAMADARNEAAEVFERRVRDLDEKGKSHDEAP
jgi:hypothetical protein